MTKHDYQSIAQQVFATEAKAVADLSAQLDDQFVLAIDAMLASIAKTN